MYRQRPLGNGKRRESISACVQGEIKRRLRRIADANDVGLSWVEGKILGDAVGVPVDDFHLASGKRRKKGRAA